MFYYQIDSKDTIRYNLNKKENIYYFNAGEIFEPDLDLLSIYKKVKKKEVDNFLGEYNYFFEDEENVYLLSDELGAIKWFYYFDENSFAVSNDFWSIAKNMKLEVKDLNIDAFYEFLLFYSPLENKTFFKNIKILPQGSLLIYSKKNKNIYLHKVKKIIYSCEKKEKEVLFREIDKAFIKTIKKIKKFNENLFLGLTISGGLDSRFPLFYTKEIKKIAYLIGIKKNIKPVDLISSEKLANMFNIKLKLINPFKKHSLKEKLLIDIKRNPLNASNFLKAINKRKSFKKDEQFNVLITGAFGGLIGGRILNDDLINSKDKDLVNKMFYYYSSYSHIKLLKKGHAKLNFLKNSFNRFLVHLGLKAKKHIDFDNEVYNFINDDFLIPRKYRRKIFNTFKNYFEVKQDNLSKIMTFHLYRHTIRGAFESLHGQVKAYSIYYPYIFELSKHWPIEYLKGRKLMEEFIVWKDKKSSLIPLQTFDIPLIKKQKKYNKFNKQILKIIYFISFAIRGLVINYNKWWSFKNVQEFIDEVLKEDVKIWHKIFKDEDIKRAFAYKRYDLLLENLIKIKAILKIIENKEYDELINFKLPESKKF